MSEKPSPLMAPLVLPSQTAVTVPAPLPGRPIFVPPPGVSAAPSLPVRSESCDDGVGVPAALAGVRRAPAMGWAHLDLDPADLTPLMLAATSNSSATLIKGLLEAGAAVDAQNDGGWTALMVAAAKDNVAAVFSLLQGGADPHLSDIRGETARRKAEVAGHRWIARLLAKAESEGPQAVLGHLTVPLPSKPLPDVLPDPEEVWPTDRRPKTMSILASWNLHREKLRGSDLANNSQWPYTTAKF